MRDVSADELEEVIEGWEFWCWNKNCRNRTFTINTETGNDILLSVNSETGEKKYLKVRVLICDKCKKPTVIGTNRYWSTGDGWAARGELLTSNMAKMMAATTMWSGNGQSHHVPKEFIAFIEPSRERELPKGLSKKVVSSFREAEFALDKNKPISAAAVIRNTVRLLVEANGIDEENLKEAIKLLPFDKEYVDAMGHLKIMGDDTLHYEEYTIDELAPAVETLHLALLDYYTKQDRLAKLKKAVGDKASKQGKDKTPGK
jgi:hypothetical protein